MLSTVNFTGLSSGIDWRSMVDQLIQLEHRRIDIIDDQKNLYSNQLTAWQEVSGKLSSLESKAEALDDESDWNVFSSSLSSSSSTIDAEDLVSVSTTSSASVGTHELVINQKATAQKLSSKSYSDKSAALGLSGEFLINGRVVSVSSNDSLVDIKNSINDLSSGENAINVSASIIKISDTDYRLILSSTATGADGLDIREVNNSDILENIGLIDGTVSVAHYTSDGAKSGTFDSSTTVVADLLNLSNAPGATTVTIGGQNVSIDLTTESITDIAANINALTGITASVVSEEDDNGSTVYRIDISGTTSFSDSNNVLQTLGILKGDHSDVYEIHTGDVANSKTSAAGGGAITDSTLWNEINTGSDSNNITLNDTITITGTKHDGTSVSTTFTISNLSEALNASGGFLETIENAFGGSSAVDAYISDGSDGYTAGTLVVKDLVAGDSQLSVSVVANNEGGGTLNFGTVSAAQEGRSMEIQAGQDAVFTLDGVTMSNSSNSITDAISGVTLDILKADSSVTVTVNITRDLEEIKSKISDFVSAYNEIKTYINEQFSYTEDEGAGGILFGDSTLRSVQSSLASTILSEISNIDDYYSLSLVGITLDEDGLLEVDDADLTDALEDDFSQVRNLFIASSTTTSSDVSYIYHTRDTQEGVFDIYITQAATKATQTGLVDLNDSDGLDSDQTLIITDESGNKATVALTSGQKIDAIVAAINSELESTYQQEVTHSAQLDKTTAAGGGYINSATTWSEINTGGDSNDISDGDTITITGTDRSGSSVSATYTISDKTTDTVNGLLAAIESAFDNDVIATVNSTGQIVVTDRYVGNSQLSISLVANNEGGGSLSFGTSSTTTTGRYAMSMSASNSSGNLVITHDFYGSSPNVKISGYATTGSQEILTGTVANTESGSPITSSTVITNIDGYTTFTSGDKITISGYDHSGSAITSVDLNISDGVTTIGDLLTQIESAFSNNVTASVTTDGKIKVTDDTTGESKLVVTLSTTIQDGSSSLDFGTLVDDLGLENSTASGLDVAGTINGESATGSGQILTGDSDNDSTDGLSIKYSGTSTGSQGNITLTFGIAELIDRLMFTINDSVDGYVGYKQTSLQENVDRLDERIEELEDRLAIKQEQLINQFIYMEVYMARIQSQSNWLSGQIESLGNYM